jgi:hypothetical protein
MTKTFIHLVNNVSITPRLYPIPRPEGIFQGELFGVL